MHQFDLFVGMREEYIITEFYGMKIMEISICRSVKVIFFYGKSTIHVLTDVLFCLGCLFMLFYKSIMTLSITSKIQCSILFRDL